ncbi:hypothetical protein [Nonomuraea sp. NEAU-A123]|uniref:hypothetical protein n=1 Tax=Nonomuraea sp. NEAU-A123 TaxID=2839649 RepID=UPI001BE46C04|nr:hypothetical protein [Nonomuraea sp. NEAU-A123]MBT2232609.1 hypothetical protein [Nonomuraea sp. NEAU-A123]
MEQYPEKAFDPKAKAKAEAAPKAKAALDPKAQAAADSLVDWLSNQEFTKDSNYTVAVTTGGDLVVSKVDGLSVTTKAGSPGQKIIQHVKDNDATYGNYNIYAVGKFTRDGLNNHAEMCIFAYSGKDGVAYIKCTSPNCKLCKRTLEAYNVTNGNEKDPREPASQVGWFHPFLPVTYGTGRANKAIEEQLTELEKVSQMDASSKSVDKSSFVYGGETPSKPYKPKVKFIHEATQTEKTAKESEEKKTSGRKSIIPKGGDGSTFSKTKRTGPKQTNAPRTKPSGDGNEIKSSRGRKVAASSDSPGDTESGSSGKAEDEQPIARRTRLQSGGDGGKAKGGDGAANTAVGKQSTARRARSKSPRKRRGSSTKR